MMVGENIKKFWHEQTYLMTNYRMDIAAKELEKWSKGFNLPVYMEDDARK